MSYVDGPLQTANSDVSQVLIVPVKHRNVNENEGDS